MLSIARELDLAESVFVWPAENDNCDRRIRFFSPGREFDFGGHPLLATCLVLASCGEIELNQPDTMLRLELICGVIQVNIPFTFKNARFECVYFGEGLRRRAAGIAIYFKDLQRRSSRKDACYKWVFLSEKGILASIQGNWPHPRADNRPARFPDDLASLDKPRGAPAGVSGFERQYFGLRGWRGITGRYCAGLGFVGKAQKSAHSRVM